MLTVVNILFFLNSALNYMSIHIPICFSNSREVVIIKTWGLMYKRCIRTKWAKKCAYAVFQAHIWIYKKKLLDVNMCAPYGCSWLALKKVFLRRFWRTHGFKNLNTLVQTQNLAFVRMYNFRFYTLGPWFDHKLNILWLHNYMKLNLTKAIPS